MLQIFGVWLQTSHSDAPPIYFAAVGRALYQVKLHGGRDGRDEPPEGRRPRHPPQDALHLPCRSAGHDAAEIHLAPGLHLRIVIKFELCTI